MVWTVFRALILTLLFSLIACGPSGRYQQPKMQNNGGNEPSPGTAGDAGGGKTKPATKEQVKQAIKDTLLLFTDGYFGGGGNIFDAVYSNYYKEPKPKEILLLDEIEEAGDHKEIILQSRISFDMKDCGLHPEDQAAVSELKIGATICFNVESLQKLPSTSVLLALIAHEYVHLLGKGEAEADMVQQMIVDSWDQILEEHAVEFMKAQVHSLDSFFHEANDASFYAKHKNEPVALAKLKLASVHIESFMNNIRFAAYGPSLMVGDRDKLVDYVGLAMWADSKYKTSAGYYEALSQPLADRIKINEEIFCQIAKNYFGIRKALVPPAVSVDNDKYPHYREVIYIQAKEVAISCPQVPREKFMLPSDGVAAPTERQSESSRQ